MLLEVCIYFAISLYDRVSVINWHQKEFVYDDSIRRIFRNKVIDSQGGKGLQYLCAR